MIEAEIRLELELLLARIGRSGEGFNDCNLKLEKKLREALEEYRSRYSADDDYSTDEDE